MAVVFIVVAALLPMRALAATGEITHADANYDGSDAHVGFSVTMDDPCTAPEGRFCYWQAKAYVEPLSAGPSCPPEPTRGSPGPGRVIWQSPRQSMFGDGQHAGLADYSIDLQGEPRSRVCLYTRIEYQSSSKVVAERDFAVGPAPAPSPTPTPTPASTPMPTSTAPGTRSLGKPKALQTAKGALGRRYGRATRRRIACDRLDAARFACRFYLRVGSTAAKKRWVVGTVFAQRSATGRVTARITAFRFRRLQL